MMVIMITLHQSLINQDGRGSYSYSSF